MKRFLIRVSNISTVLCARTSGVIVAVAGLIVTVSVRVAREQVNAGIWAFRPSRSGALRYEHNYGTASRQLARQNSPLSSARESISPLACISNTDGGPIRFYSIWAIVVVFPGKKVEPSPTKSNRIDAGCFMPNRKKMGVS